MSLRTKATLLFAVSAVLPMLIVGLLGYAHWGRVLTSLRESRTAELAAFTAGEPRDCAALAACGAVAAPRRPVERLADQGRPAETGSVRLLSGPTNFLASITSPDAADRIVVSTADPGDVVSSYAAIRRMYLYQIFVMAVATLLAFGWALRNVLRPLTLLTRAADEVAAGNFTPWSPIPVGDDEVSRLTMAFQRMAREIKELIHELEVTRPLAAIGQLASRLSHELRNPLSSIHINLQRIDTAVQRGHAPAELGRAATLALGEVHRLQHLFEGALAFGRSADPIRQRYHVHAVLQTTLALLDAELRARQASIEVERHARADAVVGDPDAIQGVLVHLVRNATDAMPDGGRIRVLTVNDESGQKIRVHVRDEGAGIPPALRDRVFAPFFTTKAGGTGLGLPTAFAAVRVSGGRLYLETRSELEPGAEFVMELPLAADNRGRLDADR